METIEIEKNELIERVRANRSKHKEDYSEMIAQYKIAVILKLDEYLDHYNSNDLVKLTFPEKPVSHLEDYDNLLLMIDMSVSKTIVLSKLDFRTYCLDQWNWKANFDFSKTMYGVM